MEKLGLDKVHQHVGQEPSGRQFDDLTLLARSAVGQLNRIPFNPMVNAGAIMTAGLISPDLKIEIYKTTIWKINRVVSKR